MPIRINLGHCPPDGGKPYKHIDLHCPHHQTVVQSGYESARLDRNPDKGKPLGQHLYRRCPWAGCFGQVDSVITPALTLPQWITNQPGDNGSHSVYILKDSLNQRAYIGYTANLRQRFAAHWRKAHRRDGAIGWLHDHMQTDPSWAPDVELIQFGSESDARACEHELQREPGDWATGWDVGGTA